VMYRSSVSYRSDDVASIFDMYIAVVLHGNSKWLRYIAVVLRDRSKRR